MEKVLTEADDLSLFLVLIEVQGKHARCASMGSLQVDAL